MNDFGTAVAELPSETEAVTPQAVSTGLEVIQRGKQIKPRRTLIYGVHGVGKSTLASNAARPIFIPTEEGCNDIDCDSFPLSESWGQFDAHLQSLATNDHDYRTIVIDSIDWLEKLIWKAVCEDKGVSQVDEIGYGKGYNAAADWWQQTIKALNYLRNEKGMFCVLLAHAKIEKFENPEDENYNRYTLALHKIASAMLQEWCDEVFFANYKVYTKSSDEGFGKTATKAIGGDERVLRTREKPFCDAKNRLNMPDEIAMCWSEYEQFFPSNEGVK